MTTPSDAPASSITVPEPGTISSYGHAWTQMWRYFLELLLVSVVSFLISIPSLGLSSDELGKFAAEHFSLNLMIVSFEGAWGYFIFAFAYVLFLEWPIEYGVAYAFLLAARNERLEVKRMFEVFKNYGNAVLANILEGVIIILGLIFLIVPGIIFGCKLAFVPYLIVERKMDAVAAIKESWRMTRGHAWKVFGIGFVAIFIALLGLLFFGIGIILSIIWIRLASATLYYSVSASMSVTQEPRPGM
jgi:uncharacterized membrane protein